MGWSCTATAAHVMDDWTAKCRSQGGSSNSYVGKDGRGYFIQWSRKEHDDGRITGTVYGDLPDGVHVRKTGTVNIAADGMVGRYPTSWPFPRN